MCVCGRGCVGVGVCVWTWVCVCVDVGVGLGLGLFVLRGGAAFLSVLSWLVCYTHVFPCNTPCLCPLLFS